MKTGDLVHYIPFKGCDETLIENGKVKSFADSGNPFVVYHCNNEWDKWMDYTGQNTPLGCVRLGWYEKVVGPFIVEDREDALEQVKELIKL